MRQLYEQVRNNDAAMVQSELVSANSGNTLEVNGTQFAWITIASANVIPEVTIIAILYFVQQLNPILISR